MPIALPSQRLADAAMDALARQDADIIMARLYEIVIPGWVAAPVVVGLLTLLCILLEQLVTFIRPKIRQAG